MTRALKNFASAFAFYIMLLCLWSGIAIGTKSELTSQIKFTLYSIYKSQFSTIVNVKDLTILLIEDVQNKFDDKNKR